MIDIVKDTVTGADYIEEEDPVLYVSNKTGRGPLTDEWLKIYWEAVKGKSQPTPDNKSLMCAYKLCRVEFRYWGMQTKLEKFIHDVGKENIDIRLQQYNIQINKTILALRKTMVKAHKQAWAWQDEWHGLTMDDIREIERQTQLALQKKMAGGESDGIDENETQPDDQGAEHFKDDVQDSHPQQNFKSTSKHVSLKKFKNRHYSFFTLVRKIV